MTPAKLLIAQRLAEVAVELRSIAEVSGPNGPHERTT